MSLNHRGDTIVEVLMVIIVIGTVLASAYSIATRSLQSTQLVQERNYALKLAEGQLEALRSKASSDAGAVTAMGTSDFCVEGGAVYKTSTDPSKCKQDPNSSSCTSASSYCYDVSVGNLSGSNNYTTTVKWDGPDGVPQQVQLSYRIYL